MYSHPGDESQGSVGHPDLFGVLREQRRKLAYMGKDKPRLSTMFPIDSEKKERIVKILIPSDSVEFR